MLASGTTLRMGPQRMTSSDSVTVYDVLANIQAIIPTTARHNAPASDMDSSGATRSLAPNFQITASSGAKITITSHASTRDRKQTPCSS